MTELLPAQQADNLRSSLLEYLGTTFSLADPDTRFALESFLKDPDQGLFRGPYVRLRAPFAPATNNWRDTLDFYDGPLPYGHQAAAFERLTSKGGHRPQPTIVTTGTGSGKTEAFLAPIVDHVLRAKEAGVAGTKAIILYPMNALANDQARRLTSILTSNPELSGITGALYTGQGGPERSKVTAEGLITSREIIRDTAPDILLTNYKMLDQLLLRYADSKIWKQSAKSLSYLVIDEFHTYDGAQGTDVSMLLRRLGLTLKSYWQVDDPDLTPADWDRPLGLVTPIATSATLGDKGDSLAMLDFARTVTGETLTPDAVITETRLSLDDWIGGAGQTTSHLGLAPVTVDADVIRAVDDALRAQITDGHDGIPLSDPDAATRTVLTHLFTTDPATIDPASHRPDLSTFTDLELLELAKAHPFIRTLTTEATNAISLADLTRVAFPNLRLREGRTADPALFIAVVLSVLSHLRAATGHAALSVDIHLWVRELTRVDRTATHTASFRWSDDGVVVQDGDDPSAAAFPAIYCRHCGRSGWGVMLAPTGSDLDTNDSDIRVRHMRRDDRFRPLLHAPNEGEGEQDSTSLMWFHVRERHLLGARPDQAALDSGDVIPVLTHRGEDAGNNSTKDVCPSCESPDSIRFLGSAIATLLSVTLSGLFGSAGLDAREKKALVFTDSVQDAAHRAGFVQARSHALTLRSVLRDGVSDDPIDLTRLVEDILRSTGSDPVKRYRLLPPDLADRERFAPYWRPGAPRADANKAERLVKRRLLLDVELEFGLRSSVGRTLEATASVVTDVDADDAVLLASARDALTVADAALIDVLGPDDTALVRWVRGVLLRMRTRGAIEHEWFDRFRREDGNRWWVSGGRRRDQGMPGFGRGNSAPGYPFVGAKLGGGVEKDSDLEPIASARGWYAGWTTKCLGHDRAGSAVIARALFAALARRDVIGQVASGSGVSTYHLRPDRVIVAAAPLKLALQGELSVICNTCGSATPGPTGLVAALVGGPCLVDRCSGQLEHHRRDDNFYRRMYAASDVRRVVAREHTSLLPDDVRLDYEERFKSPQSGPDAPNVLVATPTLEMGIDIGDLSTVMLSSLPRSVASYLQRVGRAGRLTGNALTLAFVTARGDQLPRFSDPLATINGAVRPPATYLDAEEILQRQYIASLADSFARTATDPHPSTSADALGSSEDGTFLGALIAAGENPDRLTQFLGTFDGLSQAVIDRMREWAGPPVSEDGRSVTGTSQLAVRCHAASAAWRSRVEALEYRRREIEQALPEIQMRAESPASTKDDERDLRTTKTAYKLAGKQLGDLRGEYWISSLEAFGLLPNYTLLDDSVTLEVGLSWMDPETQEYTDEQIVIERGSAQALRDFAPGSTFYARGYAVKIDAVDLGRGEEAVRLWACCPDCGYVADTGAAGSSSVTHCPRCGSAGVADVAQHVPVVELKRVSSVMRREEAVIDDNRDERITERFSIVTLADIDPSGTTRTWYVDGLGFGGRHVRDITLRWLNLGPSASRGTTHTLGGGATDAALFRLCSSCGKVDSASGSNRASEHRPWCPQRRESIEKTTSVALARTLQTEGLVLRLPRKITIGDQFAVPSLSAALLLALRERIGGSPDHLAVVAIADPTLAQDGNPDALLLHDVVPGGTGYLAELADPEAMWSMLHRAWEVLRDCTCQADGRLACENCLLPFAPPGNIRLVSRAAAERSLATILRSGSSAPSDSDDVPSTMAWVVTTDEPAAPDRESHLEQRFREVLRNRLQTLGATVAEVPSAVGNIWNVTMPGGGVRWRIEPQQVIAGSKPDFVLTSSQRGIPPTAIFVDGWRFHAHPSTNRIADDAAKRETLRLAGYRVLSLTWDDVEAGPGHTVSVPWLVSGARELVVEQAGDKLAPAAVDLVTRSPFELLISWIVDPNPEQLAQLGHWLPLLMVPATGDTFTDNVGRWTHGPLTIDLRLSHEESWTFDVAATLDDSAEALTRDDHRDAWREWLRISNLLAFRTAATSISSTSRQALDAPRALETEPLEGTPELPADDVTARWDLQWRALYEDATQPEQVLVRALVELHFPLDAPVLGEEFGDGIPVSMAWPDALLAVDFGDMDPEDRESLISGGWRVVAADPDIIKEALSVS